MALELDHHASARGDPRGPQRVPRGLGAGAREADELGARDHLRQPLGEPRLGLGLVAAHDPELGGPGDRLVDRRMAVARAATAPNDMLRSMNSRPSTSHTRPPRRPLGEQRPAERRRGSGPTPSPRPAGAAARAPTGVPTPLPSMDAGHGIAAWSSATGARLGPDRNPSKWYRNAICSIDRPAARPALPSDSRVTRTVASGRSRTARAAAASRCPARSAAGCGRRRPGRTRARAPRTSPGRTRGRAPGRSRSARSARGGCRPAA